MPMTVEEDIDIAGQFAKEAYWDLQVVRKLLEDLKLDTCESDEQVFYIGRRVLYMLQQASEKVAKAYLFIYLKPWIEEMISIVGEVDRNKYYKIFQMQERFRNLGLKLKPKQVGHKLHKAFLSIICDFYEIFYDRKRDTLEYIQFFTNKLSQLISENLFKSLKEGGESSSSISAGENAEIYIKNVLMSVLTNDLINVVKEFKLPGHAYRTLKQVCKRGKNGSSFPSCIDEKALESLKTRKEEYKKLVAIIEDQVTKEKERIHEYIKPYIKPLTDEITITKIVRDMSEDHVREEVERLTESYLELLSPYLRNLIIGLYFYTYLLAYLFAVYPCLSLYEDVGRYPDVVDMRENRGRICQDIEKLKIIEDEVELIVNVVKGAIEAYGHLSEDAVFLLESTLRNK
jgi:hypothetical protein